MLLELIAVGAAVLVCLALVIVIVRRHAATRVTLQPLSPADAVRYRGEMQAAKDVLGQAPNQAAARARGIVEEVMRRRGFPARLDGEQPIKDLRSHDRLAAERLAAAHGDLRAATDAGAARRAVDGYMAVLERLLHGTTRSDA